MKSKESVSELRRLSQSVGEFIRYWGFRRVHGAIWTQLYLDKEPLSCTHLAKRLAISKALVSPALAELVDWKLIYETNAHNEKTKLYTASEDVSGVIRYVLKMREEKMMQKISQNLKLLKEAKTTNVRADRIENIAQMIHSAELMLSLMTATDDLFEVPHLLGTKSI